MSVGSLADAFAFAMTKSVTIAPYLGVSGNGARQYGPAKTYPCRISETQTPIFTATGQQVVSTTTIAVYPRATDGTVLAAVNADARLTLPDATAPRILRAGSVDDLDGGVIYWVLHT
jgi:hypothetical protein